MVHTKSLVPLRTVNFVLVSVFFLIKMPASKLYVLKNSRVHTMHKVPNPIILKYLPDLLDPMFLFLTDEKHEIYVRCQRELLVFLDLIEKNPPQSEEFVKMVNNLVVHVQSNNIRMQTMSVHWLRAFVGIPGMYLLTYVFVVHMVLFF